VLAPSKLRYFKNNWLTALSVVLPALRSVRLLRAARALRGLSLVRIVTTLNRGSKVLGHLAHRGQFGYVLLLTLVVTITAAAAVYYFERTEPGASIRTVGDALWWAASIITTISSPLEAVTLEGRVVALLLRIFALAVSGYLTAVVAVYLLGGMARPIGDTEERTNDFRQLHREIQRLERLIERRLPHGQAGGEATGAVHQDRRKYVKSSAVDRGDRS
jgi:voltage-gated potassium channel